MSTMKWTFKGTKDAFTPNADKITVTEYEFYTDSRGNPQVLQEPQNTMRV